MHFEKVKKIEDLRRGDIIRHVSGDGKSMVVDNLHGDHVTAVFTMDISNPIEWEVWREYQPAPPQ